MERCLAVRLRVRSGSRKACTTFSWSSVTEGSTLPWPLERLPCKVFMQRRLNCESHPLEEICLAINIWQVMRGGFYRKKAPQGWQSNMRGG